MRIIALLVLVVFSSCSPLQQVQRKEKSSKFNDTINLLIDTKNVVSLEYLYGTRTKKIKGRLCSVPDDSLLVKVISLKSNNNNVVISKTSVYSIVYRKDVNKIILYSLTVFSILLLLFFIELTTFDIPLS